MHSDCKISYKYQPPPRTKIEEKLEKVKADREKAKKNMHESVAAFVTFDHVESRRRCLKDYSTANSLAGRLLMPRDLQFKISKERLDVSECVNA